MLWIIKRKMGQDAIKCIASIEMEHTTSGCRGETNFHSSFIHSPFSLFTRIYAADLFISRNVCMQVARRRDGLGQNRIIQQPGGCVSVIGFSSFLSFGLTTTRSFSKIHRRGNNQLFSIHNDDNSTHNTSSCSAPGATAVCSYTFLLLKHTGRFGRQLFKACTTTHETRRVQRLELVF